MLISLALERFKRWCGGFYIFQIKGILLIRWNIFHLMENKTHVRYFEIMYGSGPDSANSDKK